MDRQQATYGNARYAKKYSIAGINVRITVDDDQETDTPRGLIYDSCNTGLGRFKNGEDHLQNAIDYLAYTENRGGEGCQAE